MHITDHTAVRYTQIYLIKRADEQIHVMDFFLDLGVYVECSHNHAC